MFNMAPAMPRWFAVSVLATHTSALRFSIDASHVARRRVLSRAKPEVAALASVGAEAGRKHFIRNIIEEDLASGKHKTIITRFPPEPNGYLHIGHAKSICLNFELGATYQGHTHMRFDDTNPAKEDMEYVTSILEDVRWLMAGRPGISVEGQDPWFGPVRHTSDYFDVLYQCALSLIDQDKAYVDFLSATEMAEYRGSLTVPGRNSPDRELNRSPAENRALFEAMANGEYQEGSAPILRAKLDMQSSNMNMRDPALYRVKTATHPLAGDKWKVYPMYDFAHAVSDAVEGITHSLCTLEFADHRPLYDWTIDSLQHTGLLEYPPKTSEQQLVAGKAPADDAVVAGAANNIEERPRQIEFSRLNLQYTVLSKRKLIQLVNEKHVSGWDDPRMPTLAGVRRRGIPPAALRLFCDRVGISKAENNIDMAVLEDCARAVLDEESPRLLAVLKPLKVTITNWPSDVKVETFDVPAHPRLESKGGASSDSDAGNDSSGGEGYFKERQVPMTSEVYIDADDFCEVNPPKGFNRLVPGGSVRLRYAYVITCDEVVKDATTGEVTELKCSYRPDTRSGATPAGMAKVKGIIQWVSCAHAIDAEVRLYDRLFSAAEPGKQQPEGDFLKDLNPASMTVIPNAKVEPALASRVPSAATSKNNDGSGSSGLQFPPPLQFERVGYFAHDIKDSSPDKPVFNRVVTLRDTWASGPAAVGADGNTGKETAKGQGAEAAGKKTKAKPAAVQRAPNPRYPYSTLSPSAQAKVGDWPRAELRVGTILECSAHPDADSLLVSKVDCGDAEGPRTIVSGLAKHVDQTSSLVGKMVVVAANLAPVNMRGIASEGMLLAAAQRSSESDGSDVVELLVAPAGSEIGERLVLEGRNEADGSDALPDAVLKSEGQMKAWKRVVAALGANEEGEACFDGLKIVSSAGACKAPTLKNVPIS